MKNRITILSLLAVLFLGIGNIASAQDKATVKIRKEVNGNVEVIEKEIELNDGEDIEELLKDLGVLSEFGVVEDGEGFEIVVRKLGVDNEEVDISFYPEFEGESKSFLGVMINTHDSGNGGAVVEDIIENTAAEKAGLESGDVIYKINKEDISDYEDLVDALSESEPGEQVTIRFKRDGKNEKVKVELGEKKVENHKDMRMLREYLDSDEDSFQFYSDEPMQFHFDNDFEMEEKAFLGVTPGPHNEKGFQIGSVIGDSSAETAGLQAGDVVLEIDGESIADFDALADAVQAKVPGDNMHLKVERDGEVMEFDAKLGGKESMSHGDIRIFKDFKGCDEMGDEHYEFQFDMDGFSENMEEFRLELEGLGEEMHILSEGLGEGLEGMMIVIDSTLSAMEFNFDRPDGYVVTDEISINIEIDNISEEEAAAINEIADEKLQITNDLGMETISFFPNPTDGQFMLKFDLEEEGEARVMLYNQQGSVIFDDVVQNEDGSYQNIIDISNESTGTYYLQILQAGKAYSKKIVKN